MTDNSALGLTKVTRQVVAKGEAATIECALTKDLASPALEAMMQLKECIWPDPDGRALPDEQQANDLAMLLELIEDLASGEDPPAGFYNFLKDGIWELKVHGIRMTFYDTDGAGRLVTRGFERSDRDHRLKLLPMDFGSTIRLGHTFGKPVSVRRTEPEELKSAFQVRKEDLQHDERNRKQNGW
ncbi:MAG: hypothetical protein WAS54_07565 [Scrofimicrobium sp.]